MARFSLNPQKHSGRKETGKTGRNSERIKSLYSEYSLFKTCGFGVNGRSFCEMVENIRGVDLRNFEQKELEEVI